ncbi:MAG: C45 family autoproteolytic acyltransferase/hydrolase [bacterium]
MITLSLSGDSYEIGFQHGEQLKNLIHDKIRKCCRFYDENKIPDKNLLEKKIKKLQINFPEILQEIRGIADGSDNSFDDILILNFIPWENSCTNIAFLEDKQPILGHVNDDNDPTGDIAFKITKNNEKKLHYIGLAGSVGVSAALNSYGLALSHSCARSNGIKNRDEFLNLGVFRRIIAEKCQNCEQAKQFITDNSFYSGADNIICIDKSKSAFVAEKLPTEVEFRYPEKRTIFCTGRFLSSKISRLTKQDEYENENKAIEILINRENYIKNMIEKYVDKLSDDIMKQILCCNEKNIEVCNKLSNWAAILSPKKFELFLADRYPCYNEFIKI